MSTDLLTHRGRRSLQPFSHVADALARSNATGDLFALYKAQHPRRTAPMVGAIPPVDSSTRRTAELPRPRARPIPRIDSPALYMRQSSAHWESLNNRRRPPLMRHLLVVRLQPRCFADRLRPPNPCLRNVLLPMSPERTLKVWWPGTELNRRRQAFQGWIQSF